MNPKFKIERSRQDLILKQPFFGSLLIRLEPKELSEAEAAAKGIADFATDGIHLLYRSSGVDKMSEPEVIGTLCHETLHCALGHIFRLRNRDMARFNRAADYVINPIVKDAGLVMPSDSLFNPAYSKLNAEQVYTLLEEEDKKDPNKAERESLIAGFDVQPPSKDANGDTPSEQELDTLAADWKTAALQAAIYAKSHGSLPGSLETMLEELTKVKFPWREILANYCMKSRPSRNDWSRRSRRSAGLGVYLPNRYYEPTGDFVIVQDTSASVSNKELSEGYAETRALIQQIQPDRCILIQCDTHIRQIDEYTAETFPESITDILIKGRGGTSFQPPFDYLDKEGIVPDALIYFTDGECSWPKEPNYPVLWALTRELPKPPPFGEYLWLEL